MKSFTAAMLQFFGVLPNQSNTQFARELRSLTYEDKMEFHAALNAQGILCTEPAKAK